MEDSLSMPDNVVVQREKGKPRILIVGGVAGGASCATRARRLSEDAEIIIFERGPYVSFANCGLPYYVGNVITNEESLLVATPELFKDRFDIAVRLQTEVQAIDRAKQEITVKNLTTGEMHREHYDALLLAPGAKPVQPPLPGINLPGIFTLRSIPDSREIMQWITEKKARRAVIVGGGFIGLEMTDNLARRGLSITIVEMLPQVMPGIDAEMAVLLQEHLMAKGVSLCLGDGVARFEQSAETALSVITQSGKEYPCDIVILAIGVRPDIVLARDAGLEIGQQGGIHVDDSMHTSDKKIWAVGDAVEVHNFITGEGSLVPLASPANRQGRLAADSILGREVKFRGVQGTMVCKVFDITVAATGAPEKRLRQLAKNKSIKYEKVYLYPNQHAGYYPGVKPIMIKLLFSPVDGKVLGAQAVGEEGIEKRIDVIAMAIQKGATVFDLEEVELCYAPQFGSAKDPVNMAGMVAANMLRGDAPMTHWTDRIADDMFLLDVREIQEFKSGHVAGAINVPLHTLRKKLTELPRDKEIMVYCASGLRSYIATRILLQNGFTAKNISGGILVYNMRKKATGR